MGNHVFILEIMDELYKFSTMREIDTFVESFEKDTIVKVYIPNKIVIMVVK